MIGSLAVLSGCNKGAPVSRAEPTGTVSPTNSAANTNKPTPTSTIAPTSTITTGVGIKPDSQNTYIIKEQDMDNNGDMDYILLNENQSDWQLQIKLNNEIICEYVDQTDIIGSDQVDYFDIDNDGNNELYVSFNPNVNSASLEEWILLKKDNVGWSIMKYPSDSENDNPVFPVKVLLGENEFEFVITCDGYEKTITFDATDNYTDELINESEESFLQQFKDQNFKPGDEVGFISAWGVWTIKRVVYEGKECLVATQGLNGALGRNDFLGTTDIYFNYDIDGEINILDIVFSRRNDGKPNNFK